MFPEGEREEQELEPGYLYVAVLLDWAGRAVAACTISKLFSSYSILPPPLLRREASLGVT